MWSDLENIVYAHALHVQSNEAHSSQIVSLGRFSGQYLEALTEASVRGNNTEIVSSQSQYGAACRENF